MYDELVKDLREISRNRAIPVHMAETVKEAANAIENMSEAYDKLSRHMDDLAALMPRWIPVSERLPEKAGHYIVFVELKRNGQKISAWTQAAWFFGDFLLECPEDEERFVAAVTHWQPLPEPPEEET